MSDAFTSHIDTSSAPSRAPYAVEPDDTRRLDPLPKALLIGGGGVLTMRGVDSAADISVPVVAGQVVPVRAAYVRATGTSATAIVALA